MKYDVILVGGGIANIALAIQLIKNLPDVSILILEKGKDIKNRYCPKAKTGKCINCNPCNITSGFGGAGCFSDCKLTYSKEVGGTLIDYIGEESFEALQKEADSLFTEFGAKGPLVFNGDYADKLAYECSKYGMKLIKGGIRHLGTDGAYDVMLNMRNYLKEADEKNDKIDIISNATVTDIDFDNKKVYADIHGEKHVYEYNYLSVAVGRSGSDWLRDICIKNGIKMVNNSVDIGVRVECPRAVTDPVTDNLYEFKIVNYSSSDNKVRTFCVNPGGYVVSEKWDT